MASTATDVKNVITQLQADLSYLATAPDVNISRLSRKSPSYQVYLRAFKAIQELYITLSADEYKQHVIDHIRTFKRPTDIVPETMGAFLFGCLYNIPEGTNPFCSPACKESIPPTPVSDVIVPCDYNVWAIVGGELRHHSGSGQEARVYNVQEDLSPAMLSLLASNGVKRVITYNSSGVQQGIQSTDSNNQPEIKKAVTFATPIATAIPATASPIDVVAAASLLGQERGPTSFLSDWRVILVIVLIIVAVGIVVYMLYKYFSAKPADKQQATASQQPAAIQPISNRQQ